MNQPKAADHAAGRCERSPEHEIRPMETADVGAVSRIHCAVMPDGLLARLGPEVVSHIYAGALTCSATIALVAQSAGEVSGFLLATTHTGSLFRHVLWTRAIPLGVHLVKALIRNPTVFPQVVATLKYPRLESTCPPAELVAMGVSPDHRRNGRAAAMGDVLNRTFGQMGVRRYVVAVYSSNAHAQVFYRRLGFRSVGGFSLYERAWVRLELDLSTTAGRLRSQANAKHPARGPEA